MRPQDSLRQIGEDAQQAHAQGGVSSQLLWSIDVLDLLVKLKEIIILIIFDTLNNRQLKNTFEIVKRFLTNCLRSGGLNLSLMKITAMQFSGAEIDLSEYKFMGYTLRRATEMKYLGLMMNTELN